MVIVNSKIVPKGYHGITIYPFIFLSEERHKNNKTLVNHEKIHLKQQLEMLIIPFYLWYVIEYVWRLIQYNGNKSKAYRNISFEREAYSNQRDLEYDRKMFSSLKYL